MRHTQSLINLFIRYELGLCCGYGRSKSLCVVGSSVTGNYYHYNSNRLGRTLSPQYNRSIPVRGDFTCENIGLNVKILQARPTSIQRNQRGQNQGYSTSSDMYGWIEDKMEEFGVVPDVVDVAPSKSVEVSYNDLTVDLGNELTPTQVQNIPTTITWDADKGTYYTLIMTDPDAPSRANPKFREWHHWLVGNIPGNDVAQGETLSQYIGSGPPKGTGLHRYVYLVYKQPGKLTFDEPRLTNTSGQNRGKFSARDFANKYGLILEAGNFFQAQYDAYCEKIYAQLKD